MSSNLLYIVYNKKTLWSSILNKVFKKIKMGRLKIILSHLVEVGERIVYLFFFTIDITSTPTIDRPIAMFRIIRDMLVVLRFIFSEYFFEN